MTPGEPSRFVVWLDQTLGPPWSGFCVLALIGLMQWLAVWAVLRTMYGPPRRPR